MKRKFNPPLLSPLDHSHWCQELNLVQILLLPVALVNLLL
jgi:hypothetical protein